MSNCSIPWDFYLQLDVNVLFAENGPKDQYNCIKLETLKQQLVEISTTYQVSSGVTTDMLINIANNSLNKTGNLGSKPKLKRHLRVMLATNLDISDRFINGQ